MDMGVVNVHKPTNCHLQQAFVMLSFLAKFKKMKYTEHSLKAKSKKKLTTDWSFNEGVFETQKGDFIVRIKKKNKNLYETLSRHKTYEEAMDAFNFAKNGA